METSLDSGFYSFLCPHCENMIEVAQNEVNCSIFRHGYFYTMVNNKIILLSQVPPHSPKQMCDSLVEQNKVIGCCKPFKMVLKEPQKYLVEKCDYI